MTICGTPARTVARPVANLGNTCYMNAVLQTLAHAPELCLAMDCEPHHQSCPIAAENAGKRGATPSSSPDNLDTSNNGAREVKKTGTRKSRRPGRKSPLEGDDSQGSEFRFCVLCEIEDHIRQVHDLSRRDKPVAPTTFVKGFIEHVAPWFKLGVQEDSHEFLRLLIDAMQKSCTTARVAEASKRLHEVGHGSSSSPEEAKNREDDHEYPFSLFRGTVESNVTCDSCRATSSTLDPIEDVGLEVTIPQQNINSTSANLMTSDLSPTQSALIDVTTSFQHFARVEALDAGYKCEKCGKVGRATKQSRLASIPPILTLHLKRFRYGDSRGASSSTALVGRRAGRSEVNQLLGNGSDYLGGRSGSAKIEGHVKFDLIFDLKPFLTAELQANHKSMFCRLFAVIVHSGMNSHSGHYVAYVRSIARNDWWKMDDGRVTQATETEVKQAEAYMLFYRVVQHPLSVQLEERFKLKSNSVPTSPSLVETKNNVDDPVEAETISIDDEVALSTASNGLEPDTSIAGASPLSQQEANLSVQESVGAKRARSSEEELLYGAEWARKKLKGSPRVVQAIVKAQEMIAEEIMLSPSALEKISQEAREGAVAGNRPTLTIHESDALGGTEKIRQKIRRLLFALDRYGDPEGKGHFLFSTFLNKTEWGSSTSSKDTRVAVVEPEDPDLL